VTCVIVWEFRVPAAHEKEFEAAYGAGGEWAQLFALSPDYEGTELLRDESTRGRYLTVDRWASAEAFVDFRRLHSVEYEALDARCEAWTESERKIGTWAAP
jgi:heme-degrading monooxygenase HmoA